MGSAWSPPLIQSVSSAPGAGLLPPGMTISPGGIITQEAFGAAAVSIWSDDPQILAWYEADNGLTNKFAASPWGNLTQVSGTVPIGGGLDGHPAYQFTKGVSGLLVTANTGPAVRFYGPVHIIAIVKDTGSAGGDTWFADPASAAPRIGRTNAANAFVTSNSSFLVPATIANFNCYNLYLHGSLSRFSVNGAAYSASQNTGTTCDFDGMVLGAGASGGGFNSSCEIAFWFAYEGMLPDSTMAGLWAYLRAKFPSLSLPASAQPAFSIAPTDPNSLLVPPFDVLPFAGQSNSSSAYSNAATVPFSAGILMLGNDGVYKVATDLYDDQTNHADIVSVEPNTPKTFGGEAAAMCNAVRARTGRTLVLIPGMLGSSSIVGGVTVPPQNFWWDPGYPRGFKLANSLYGSWVRRTKDALSRGGTYLFTGWDQGEAESGSSPTLGNQWPNAFTALMNSFHADIGVTKKVVFVQLSLNIGTLFGTNGANFRAITQPLAIGAGQVMASAPDGPYNANPDQVHRQGSGCDVTGANIAAAAIAAGYI